MALELPPRPNKKFWNQSMLVADCLDLSPAKYAIPKPNSIKWDQMQIQDYQRKPNPITTKKRKLYKK